MKQTDSFFSVIIRVVYKTSVVLVLLLGSPSAYTQVLTNGDFETGDFSGWVNSGNVFVIDSAVISGSWSLDFNGGDTSPDGEIYQTAAVTIGEHYELTFKYGWLGRNNSQQLNIQVDGANGVGSLIDSKIDVNNAYRSPKTFSEPFTADTSTVTLRISDVLTNTSFGSDMLIDDIGIQPVLVFSDGFEE